MGKPKCKECNSCMDFLWVENNRYLYCDFCDKYYGGHIKELTLVENPFLIDCPNCGGVGEFEQEVESIEHVTREMAIDAGDILLAGEPIKTKMLITVTCPLCLGKRKVDRRSLK